MIHFMGEFEEYETNIKPVYIIRFNTSLSKLHITSTMHLPNFAG